MAPVVPDWCAVTRGPAPILLIAPHGGRRPPVDPLAPPANLRVNDVHTPAVTHALARRIGAGAIVNSGMDRNRIDLNRASQVRSEAPWFLDLIATEVSALVERHGRAEVIFVHGWNNGQLKCDIGLGGVEREGVITAPAGRRLSVSPAYLGGRVLALRRACTARGIAAPVGEKYPASHPNNLVQAFTAGSGTDARLERLAAAGVVDALQLELTLPLRCPGGWRERFLAAATAAFTGEPPLAEAPMPDDATTAPERALPAAAESVQLYDPVAGIGLFAGSGRMGARTTGARLLLFLGGQRIALFTGEEVGDGDVPPLRFRRRGKRLDVHFDGPILAIADAAEYLDLEAALATSQTVDAGVSLSFDEIARADGSAAFGRVRGEIAIDGQRRELDTQGFSHVAALRAAASGQTMLAASFGERGALVGRIAHDGEPRPAVHFTGERASLLARSELSVIDGGDAYTPSGFELHLGERPTLRAEALNRMAILRSSPRGYVRVAFGVARFDWGGDEGFGLYEHALPLV